MSTSNKKTNIKIAIPESFKSFNFDKLYVGGKPSINQTYQNIKIYNKSENIIMSDELFVEYINLNDMRTTINLSCSCSPEMEQFFETAYDNIVEQATDENNYKSWTNDDIHQSSEDVSVDEFLRDKIKNPVSPDKNTGKKLVKFEISKYDIENDNPNRNTFTLNDVNRNKIEVSTLEDVINKIPQGSKIKIIFNLGYLSHVKDILYIKFKAHAIQLIETGTGEDTSFIDLFEVDPSKIEIGEKEKTANGLGYKSKITYNGQTFKVKISNVSLCPFPLVSKDEKTGKISYSVSMKLNNQEVYKSLTDIHNKMYEYIVDNSRALFGKAVKMPLFKANKLSPFDKYNKADTERIKNKEAPLYEPAFRLSIYDDKGTPICKYVDENDEIADFETSVTTKILKKDDKGDMVEKVVVDMSKIFDVYCYARQVWYGNKVSISWSLIKLKQVGEGSTTGGATGKTVYQFPQDDVDNETDIATTTTKKTDDDGDDDGDGNGDDNDDDDNDDDNKTNELNSSDNDDN